MIQTNANDDKEFGARFLADIMLWIGDYFEPNDVYSEHELREFMRNTYEPDEIFDHDELANWAKQNGFVYSE